MRLLQQCHHHLLQQVIQEKVFNNQDHYFNVQRDGYVIEGELKEYEDSRIKSSVQVFCKDTQSISSCSRSFVSNIITVGLTSFPDYLVLHMRNLVMEIDSVPKKLDVHIDVGDVIDITHMRSAKAPDDDIDAPIDVEAKSNDVDPSKVATLVSFGYNEETASKALKASDGDIEKATYWIFNPLVASDPLDMDATSSNEPTVDANLPDGDGS
ncbi:ubiquitin carboxyl-terminal hydrolase 14 [Tanacetum coccineum]